MALRGLLVFLERHHVHRAHGFQAGAHVAIELVFGGKLLAADRGQACVGHQLSTLDAEFVHAGLGHVLRIGLRAWRRRRTIRRGGREPDRAAGGCCAGVRRFRSGGRAAVPFQIAAGLRGFALALRSASRSAACCANCSFSCFALQLLRACRFDLGAQTRARARPFPRIAIRFAAAPPPPNDGALREWRRGPRAEKPSGPPPRGARRRAISDSCARRSAVPVACAAVPAVSISDCRAQTMPSCSARSAAKPLQFELSNTEPFAYASHLRVELLQHVAATSWPEVRLRVSRRPGDRAGK